MLHKRNLIGWLCTLLILFAASTAYSQTPVTIREINALAQENLDSLNAAGAAMTVNQLADWVVSPFDQDTVSFVAIVMSDPLDSGLATWSSSRNGPGRLHVFVRDTAAATQGIEGMTLQLVDGDWENTGTDALLVGDVIEVTGVISEFGNNIQIAPISLQVIGSMGDFGFDDSVVRPDTVDIADIIMPVDGGFQTNWSNYSSLVGQYVHIQNATILNRTLGARPDWALVDADGVRLQTYDLSLRYRNDRDGSYAAPYNVRDEDFVPPPPGAVVNMTGFLLLQPNNDPDGVALPPDASLSIIPMKDDDTEVTESPPIVAQPTGPSVIPTSAAGVTITTTVSADPSRAIDSVVVAYRSSALLDGSVQMADNGDGTWSGDIPAFPDGVHVGYSVTAYDNTGAATTTPPQFYRVLDDGINEISDIQSTIVSVLGLDPPSNLLPPPPLPESSPFAGFTTDMDITAVVMSDPASSGFIAIQDDSLGAPFTGILIEASDSLLANLAHGDQINITSGTIQETFGVTELTDITYTVVAGKAQDHIPAVPMTTTRLTTGPIAAEAYEGMLVRFENVVITTNNADSPINNDFGEFAFADLGADSTAVRSDDASPLIPGGSDMFNGGEVLEYLQGIWWFSFGNYKLIPEDSTDIGQVVNVANEPTGEGIPGKFALDQNYPNPFNPTTTISYEIGRAGQVTLEVFDITGRRITTLVNENLSVGSYKVSFDAGNLASGVYLYRLRAGDQVFTHKMLLMK